MNKNSPKKLKIIVACIIFLILCISGFVSCYVVKHLKNPDLFRKWIDSFGIFAPMIFIVITIFQVLIPIVPGEPFEIVAGYAFGAIKGCFLSLLASSIGSIIVIILVKKYGKKIVEIFFDKEKIESLKILNNSKKNVLIFSILFILPGTPKDLLCYFAGLTTIETKLLFLITTIGRIPSIITSTLVGHGISTKNYTAATIVFIISSLLSLCGILLYNKMIDKKQ